MSDILIIGNGFDLYHRLPTRYKDFMFLVTEWDTFYESYIRFEEEDTDNSTREKCNYLFVDDSMTQEALNEFGKMLGDSRFDSKEHIEYLNRNLRTNAWIQYFKSLQDDDLKWVDFEYEIQKALSLTEEYFKETISRYAERAIADLFDSMEKIERIFGWAADSEDLPLDVLSEYKLKSNSYQKYRTTIHKSGIIDRIELEQRKEQFVAAMQRELDELIACLNYYFQDFVGNIPCLWKSSQITALGHVNVLSFNYTNTFQKTYEDILEEYHAVHGSVAQNNMVLGIPDDAFSGTYDYIRFQKYFQRIQKRTGGTYRDWTEPERDDEGKLHFKNVYILGHSLCIGDFGVLGNFFNNEEVERIVIFYHNQNAYEELVINLVKALGKETVIEQIGNGRIEFRALEPIKTN